MGANQLEVIADVIKNTEGFTFITKRSKSVESSIYKKLPKSKILIDSNEPYSIIKNYVDLSEDDKIINVITNGITLLQNLPTLSSQTFKNNKIISHVELSNFDYSIITSLRNLDFPILISQTSYEAAIFTKISYNLATKLNKSIFHFFAPSSFKLDENFKINNDILIKKLENFDIEDILTEFFIEPFKIINNVKNSKDAILYFGQLNDSLINAANKENILLLSVNLYKPFYLQKLLSIIPSTIQTLTLVEQKTKSSSFSPLLLDFFQDYSKYQSLKKFTKIVSATFGYIKPENYDKFIANLLSNTKSEKPIQNLSFGKLGAELITKSSKQIIENHTQLIKNVYNTEKVYFKVLQQISSRDLNILNEYKSDNICIESNPEFGFGSFLYYQEQQQKLIDLVSEEANKNDFESINNAYLIDLLLRWLIQVKNLGEVDNKLVKRIINLLKLNKASATCKKILDSSKYLKVYQNWLIGSDAWSYDLGSSGVHDVITSGKNINMLIIDSEPYEEKKQDKNINGFRKKDVGLYAMNYGKCYVASIAIYSSYTQTLQAFIEAEKFNGPSIILAYLPYKNETDDALDILQQTKKAIDSGYWPLYRYNPNIENPADSFKLDSSNLRNQVRDFLDRENRLTLLAAKNPVLSRNLSNANSEFKNKQLELADKTYKSLLERLSGPPLTVAFASDGGNAESVAKNINRQALGRGLKSIILAMDDLSVEDLPTETNIIFITSTSGQGEFPTNGKQFWDSLKNFNNLDLSNVKFSVFGLGDSQYWPRKEDKHYYNKPAKDLFAKLKLYGGVELIGLGLGDDQDPDGFNTGLNDWQTQLWITLGVDNVGGIEEPKPLTNEDMKLQSGFLRGTIAEGLKDHSTGAISAADQQLTKFHGIYMQDDRDIRDERKSQCKEPAYAFMVRLRLPGGIATPNQYLKLDELSDTRGNGTLKLTTRATFQLHGIIKHNLKPAIRGMNSALMDTLAACGDVNRNIMVSALPHNAKVHSQISKTGAFISEYLLPQTTAYHEIWLEGEDACDQPGDSEAWENRKDGPKKTKTLIGGYVLTDIEPIYGPTYLPRKFKIVITVPPYNDVDVYAHDVGLIAIVENNIVIGYNVLAGGGMGTTHNNKKTYPRTGSMLGYVPSSKVHFVCEKIMLVQRDFGDRTNRKHARLKYTIDDLGVDVFKQKVEELLEFKFDTPKPFKIDSNIDYFGWCKDELGYNHFTAFIENGRIDDTPELPHKTGLRNIAEYLNNRRSGEFRLTGNQHLLISKIKDEDLDHVKSLLAQFKLDNINFSGLRLASAACVAFPTCGLAIAESERYLPKLITKLEDALEEYGLRHDSIVMRMTGCPNGCSRPWLAEIALVGKAYNIYNLMLGGGHHGQRLNKIYKYSIKEDEIFAILKPLFKRWCLEREEGEHFGDFCIRIGIIKPTLEGKYFHDDIPVDA